MRVVRVRSRVRVLRLCLRVCVVACRPFVSLAFLLRQCSLVLWKLLQVHVALTGRTTQELSYSTSGAVESAVVLARPSRNLPRSELGMSQFQRDSRNRLTVPDCPLGLCSFEIEKSAKVRSSGLLVISGARLFASWISVVCTLRKERWH